MMNHERPATKKSLHRSASVILASVVFVSACSGGSTARSGCDPARSEPEAADSLIHVLPGAVTAYLTDPPTSGPHQGWSAPQVLDRELSRPEQVGVLETGDVLVQYRPSDVDPQVLARLSQQIPNRFIHLAPNSSLEDPVVLTAWTTKQVCDSLDVETIASFGLKYGGRVGDH
ncbi:MAG: DUF3105 domain-containing protein [Acidimicrobiales bacterium]|jgi:hypothetical protein